MNAVDAHFQYACYFQTLGKYSTSNDVRIIKIIVNLYSRAYDTMFRCVYNITRTACTDGVSRMMTMITVKNMEQYLNVVYGCTFGM